MLNDIGAKTRIWKAVFVVSGQRLKLLKKNFIQYSVTITILCLDTRNIKQRTTRVTMFLHYSGHTFVVNVIWCKTLDFINPHTGMGGGSSS